MQSDYLRTQLFEDSRVPITAEFYREDLGRIVQNVGGFDYRYKLRMGEVHPNYNARIKAGEIIVGYLNQIERSSATVGASSWSAVNNLDSNLRGHLNGSITNYFLGLHSGVPSVSDSLKPIGSIELEDVANLAQVEAVANMDKPTFAFQEDILSLHETVRLLRHPIRTILNAVTPGRRNRFGAGVLAKSWATYSFALAPTVRSFFDLSKAMQQQQVRLESNILLRSGSVKYANDMVTNSYTSLYDWTYEVVRSRRIDAKCGIFYNLRQASQGNLFHYGIRPKDLVEGAWNIVPLSFMVDRALSVDKMLRAYTNLADPNIVLKGGYLTTSVTDVTRVAVKAIQEPGWTHSVSSDSKVISDVVVNRSKFYPTVMNLPTPRSHFRGLVSDTQKTLDLLSLMLLRLRILG